MAINQKDREEIRTMLHEVIDPWQKGREQTDRLMNISLNNIDHHLDKLNSKVAEHEKTINIHLPHTVQHCPQVEIIEKLKDNMISGKTIRNTIIGSIGLCGTLFGMFFIIYKVFIEKSP
jgi:hypothetical protein